MPKRMTVFASAILAVLVCRFGLVGPLELRPSRRRQLPRQAERGAAAGQPLVLPRGSSRQPSLLVSGAEGAKPRQAWSPKPQPAPQPAAQASIAADGNGKRRDTCATRRPRRIRRRPSPCSHRRSRHRPMPSTASRRSAINGAGEHAGMHPEDDMPLTFPSSPRPISRQPSGRPDGTAKLAPMLVYVAAALALLMIIRKIFRLFAIRRLRRRRLMLREQWNQDCGRRARANRSRRHSPAPSRQPARRTPVTSRLRYRAPPRFHSHRPMIAIPIMASKRSKLRKACSSSCMVGSAWRHEPARWGSDFPHPPD